MKKEKEKEKEKRCPFGMKCDDCKLYVTFMGGKGQRQCALILAGVR